MEAHNRMYCTVKCVDKNKAGFRNSYNINYSESGVGWLAHIPQIAADFTSGINILKSILLLLQLECGIWTLTWVLFRVCINLLVS